METVEKKSNLNDMYMSFNVNSLKVGENFSFDIYVQKENDYILIVKAGTSLSGDLYSKLLRKNDLFSRKEDTEKHGLTCTTLKDHLCNNKNNIEKSLEFLYLINKKLFTSYLESNEDKISYVCAGELVKGIIYLMNSNTHFLQKIMPHFINGYELATHSLNVTIYSMCLAKALEFNEEQLLKLGIAALLHDVGMKKIEASIIEKDNTLSLKEFERVHQHPLLSVQIIKHNKIFDPYVIDAVTHHHENYDGSGYPDGLIARQISIYPSIIAIADVFDALTNTRPNREAYNSFAALKIMMQDKSMMHKFNLKYLKAFLTLL